MQKIVFAIIICFTLGFANAEEKPKYKSTIEYIQKTRKLWGVAEVKLNSNKSVILVDAQKSGYGYSMKLFDKKFNRVDFVVLSPGEHCQLSDGHQAFIKYELKKIKGKLLTFQVTDILDARNHGGDIKENTKRLTISPYSKNE